MKAQQRTLTLLAARLGQGSRQESGEIGQNLRDFIKLTATSVRPCRLRALGQAGNSRSNTVGEVRDG